MKLSMFNSSYDRSNGSVLLTRAKHSSVAGNSVWADEQIRDAIMVSIFIGVVLFVMFAVFVCKDRLDRAQYNVVPNTRPTTDTEGRRLALTSDINRSLVDWNHWCKSSDCNVPNNQLLCTESNNSDRKVAETSL